MKHLFIIAIFFASCIKHRQQDQIVYSSGTIAAYLNTITHYPVTGENCGGRIISQQRQRFRRDILNSTALYDGWLIPSVPPWLDSIRDCPIVKSFNQGKMGMTVEQIRARFKRDRIK